jgi:hypothetical protein
MCDDGWGLETDLKKSIVYGKGTCLQWGIESVAGLKLGRVVATLGAYGGVTRLCAAHGPRGVRAVASEADLPPHHVPLTSAPQSHWCIATQDLRGDTQV